MFNPQRILALTENFVRQRNFVIRLNLAFYASLEADIRLSFSIGTEGSNSLWTNELLAPFSSKRRTRYGSSSL